MKSYIALIEDISKKSKDGFITLKQVIDSVYKIDVYSIEKLELDIVEYGLSKNWWRPEQLKKDNRFTLIIKGEYNYISLDIKILKNSLPLNNNRKTYESVILNFTGNDYLETLNKAREYFNHD